MGEAIQAPTVPRERRRSRLVATSIVTAMLIAVVGSATWWLARQVPTVDSTLFLPDNTAQLTQDSSIGGAPVYRWTYVDRAPLSYAFDVTNMGKWPIRIDGIELPRDSALVLFRPETVRLGKESSPSAAQTATRSEQVPFEPFTLKPGQQRVVFLQGYMTDCEFYKPGSSTVQRQQRLKVRQILWDYDVTLEMSLGAQVYIPSTYHCPRPLPLRR